MKRSEIINRVSADIRKATEKVLTKYQKEMHVSDEENLEDCYGIYAIDLDNQIENISVGITKILECQARNETNVEMSTEKTAPIDKYKLMHCLMVRELFEDGKLKDINALFGWHDTHIANEEFLRELATVIIKGTYSPAIIDEALNEFNIREIIGILREECTTDSNVWRS